MKFLPSGKEIFSAVAWALLSIAVLNLLLVFLPDRTVAFLVAMPFMGLLFLLVLRRGIQPAPGLSPRLITLLIYSGLFLAFQWLFTLIVLLDAREFPLRIFTIVLLAVFGTCVFHLGIAGEVGGHGEYAPVGVGAVVHNAWWILHWRSG